MAPARAQSHPHVCDIQTKRQSKALAAMCICSLSFVCSHFLLCCTGSALGCVLERRCVVHVCCVLSMQAQRQVQALAVSGLVGVLSAPLWFHLCMTVGGLGLTGSALASSLIQVCVCVCVFDIIHTACDFTQPHLTHTQTTSAHTHTHTYTEREREKCDYKRLM